jgi:hypothetical protein
MFASTDITFEQLYSRSKGHSCLAELFITHELQGIHINEFAVQRFEGRFRAHGLQQSHKLAVFLPFWRSSFLSFLRSTFLSLLRSTFPGHTVFTVWLFLQCGCIHLPKAYVSSLLPFVHLEMVVLEIRDFFSLHSLGWLTAQ